MKKKILWCGVAFFCVAVIVLGCILIPKLVQHWNQAEAAATYYDNKCFSFGVQNANLAKGQIVFIGDSITDLYVLDDHYADLPIASYNRGISGDTTEGVLKRLQVSVFDLQPSAVVLMIGTNDINVGISQDVILQRYRQILEAIYEALPEVTLFCMSIIPQNSQLETYSTISVAKTTPVILEVNQRIEALAKEKGAHYIDLFSLLADENQRLIAEYSDDGLHLNEQGLTVWTQALMPQLLLSLPCENS